MLNKLEALARKAKAHSPAPVRNLLDRLESAYHTRRGTKPAAPAPTTPPADAVDATATSAPEINWEMRSPAELVDHIEQHYHAGLRRDLPTLIVAARDLERAHAEHGSVPSGLSDLLAELFAALDSHMTREEQMLFPMLRTGARGGSIDMPMRMMERDHDEHDVGLGRIRELTHDLVAPSDGPAAWLELYAQLATLEAELRQHIYLEDRVLFARATGGRDY